MNVAHLVARAADEHGDRPAFRTLDGQTRTWAQVEADVAAVGAALHGRGVTPGERVALVLPNSLAFPTAFWGALRMGAVVVPVNPAYTAREVAHALRDSRAGLVVTDPGRSDAAEAAVAAAGSAADVVTPVELLQDGQGRDVPATVTGGQDIAVICYTSGTTGRPKGALLTHANFLANLESIGDLPRLRVDSADVLLGVLPFFHIFGLNVILNGAARHGASVLTMDRFSPVSSVRQLAEHGVTVTYGAPPVYAAWSAIPPGAVPPLPSLRAAVSGADALPISVWHAFRERFGIEILEGYGLTETAPVLASSAAAPEVRPGTVGHAVPGVRLRIVDPIGGDLRAMGPGEVGEICASGPNVFVGYHGQPDATAEVLSNGWFRTGDLGSVDADGYLRIVGRLKDMVIVSGFNVYPREIEQVLIEHERIADAAVVGLPDERTGERVRAVVVAEPGAVLSVDEVLDHCRARLARYKLPREVSIVESIPRLPTGKIHREALRNG